ncbi:DUF6670 family protein [Rhodococcus sp. B50]|uniref:DUF6670 family protein n=1 Tax=Rhodococcus sp. B50 TaxID=2682847 RepID=UPI001BD4FAA6|nr:DUF6670 family protein [Rhodococcus sp. B50]MBS9371557.1 hypothetical protein [Rhodococcus sp. B50]
MSTHADSGGCTTDQGDSVTAQGLCSFEYGAMPSPYPVRSTPLPPAAKAPLDHVVYQIVDLDADTQMLLSRYAIGGRPFMTTAILRTRSGYGTPMPVPRRTRFLVKDATGCPWLDLEATMDNPFTYGLGTGFVTGFAYAATWRGEEISGRGYVEYIDRRSTT